jgi:hypothetical protein
LCPWGRAPRYFADHLFAASWMVRSTRDIRAALAQP